MVVNMCKNDDNITVSVIIPVFNEEKYIDGCIQSLINQTFSLNEMEWIFIDGNSNDSTREIIRGYEDCYPIKLLINERKKTPISLNMGINMARGKYIARMDAHAKFPPEYIEQCIKCIEETEADNVGGYVDTKATGLIGNAVAKMLSSKFGVGGSEFRLGEYQGYVDTVPFGFFKREIFANIGLFNEELLRSEDNDINARIINSGGRVYLSKDIHSDYYCRDTVGGILKQGMQNGNALFKTLRVNPSAMKIRHYIPFIFLLSLIIMPIGAIWFWPIGYLFILEMVLYLLLDIYYSFSHNNRKLGFITIWLFPLFHISYGIGSLLGLLNIKMY